MHARGGKSFFSPVYFGPESEPYMRLAVPIEPFPGDVVGVLSAEVRLTYIRDVITQVAVGQAGYAYVVSGEGDLLAHPDLSLVLQKRNLKHLRQVQMALDGTPGPFVAQPNLAGQQVLAAYALIPAERRAMLHLAVGRLLWPRVSPQTIDTRRLYDVVHHLGAGRAALRECPEQ